MHNQIKITNEIRMEMISHIKDYFSNERDEELGDLASELILDFFINELGPYIYNQGIEDAYAYIQDKADDLFGLQIR